MSEETSPAPYVIALLACATGLIIWTLVSRGEVIPVDLDSSGSMIGCVSQQ